MASINRKELKNSCGVKVTDNLEAQVVCNQESRNGYEVVSFLFTWNVEQTLHIEAPFLEISFSMPQKDIAHMWHPLSDFDRRNADWCTFLDDMGAISAPMVCLFNESGNNCCTMAVSELRQCVQWNVDIHEEAATVLCRIRIPMELFREKGKYAIKLYRDFHDVRLEDALDQVRYWWEIDCGIHPLSVPIV